jgi:hypothetical protein
MTQLAASSGRRRRAGRMTAVMRAVRLEDSERKLRVAVVERGRVIDEHRVPPGMPVAIGDGEDALLLVSGCPVREVFVPDGNSWRLLGAAVDRGAIASPTGPEPVPSHGELRLGPDAKGKLVLANVTILFQMVEAPAPVAQPALPPSLTNGLAIDWTTTVVAAFSFLLHFFAVALVYSDWMDPIVDDELVVARLVETTRVMPAPVPLETPSVPLAPTADTSTKGEGAATDKSRVSRPSARRGPATKPAPQGPMAADAKAAEIASQLAALDIETLSALSEGGPATTHVMGSPDTPVALLDEAAASERGARRAELDGLALNGRASRDLPVGTEPRRLSDIEGGDERRVDHERAGKKQVVQGPTGNAQITGTGQSGGNIQNANAVVGRMRGRFRGCYQAGLRNHPEMEGSAGLLAKVGSSGEVTGVSGGGGGLSPIMPCLKAVVRSGGFSPPEGGTGLVSISIIFRRQ